MTRSVFSMAVAIVVVTGSEAGTGVPGLRTLSVDAAGISLEYRLGQLSLEPVTTSAGQTTRVHIPGFGTLSEEGRPALPAAGIWVALPPVGSFALRILEEETEVLPGVDAAPVERVLVVREDGSPGGPGREDGRDPGAYSAREPCPSAAAVLEDETWWRFQRVAALRLYPVRYAPAMRTLLVTRRLTLRVDFGAEGPATSQAAVERAGLEPVRASDGRFEGVYRGAVLNYEQGRAYRARPRPAGGPARSYSRYGTGNPEWKVRIDSTRGGSVAGNTRA